MNPHTPTKDTNTMTVNTLGAEPIVDELGPSKPRDWTRFEEGEIISIKDVFFKIARCEPTGLVLRPLRKEKE